jgi:L-cysteine S-thiosulfotransferase
MTRLLPAAALCAALGASPAIGEGIPPGERRSGFDTMGPETQGMQRDDTRNPAMLWVLEGSRLWRAPPEAGKEGGKEGGKEAGKQACAGCHGDAERTMAGAAARYPQIDAASGRLIDLAGRIQQCRADRQNAEPFARESRPLLALASYVGLQSRGAILAPSPDPRLAPFHDEGKALFTRRLGQLNLSCAQCHDDNWGRRLGGAPIPQGHPNGYPLYRLEWQGVGSLQRRIRNCLTGVRAQPFAYGDPELVSLELYLRDRAAGLPFEAPAVRP